MTKILSGKSDVDLDYPICRPSLDLDFTQEKLDPRVTFTRASTATRVNRNRVIETVGANVPRFDYDPVTGECRGLLIEESRQNYELYSGDPTQWASNQNMTLTGNSIVLPDGTTSTNVEYRGTDSGANIKILRPSPSGSAVVAGETWTFSIFLRAGTEQTVHLTFQNQSGGDNIGSIFNLVTGQFPGSISGSNAANGSRGFQYVGNGWYRVWLTNTYQSVSSGQQTFVRLRANTTSMQMTTSFSAWGAQLEKGAFPTSYIPTTGSTATRSADNASMTGTNFSSWYNQSEGTLYANAKSNANTLNNQITGIAAINNSSSPLTNRVDLRYHQSGGSQTNFNGVDGGGFSIARTSGFSLTNPKFAVSYAPRNVNFCVNSSLISSVVVRAAAFVPSPLVDRLLIGTFDSGITRQINGTISRLAYYPRALKPNQLQYLTQ